MSQEILKQEINVENPENKETDLMRAIKSNPCSLCRTLLLPTCKGHGGGDSGGGSDSDDADSKEKSEENYKKLTDENDSPIKISLKLNLLPNFFQEKHKLENQKFKLTNLDIEKISQILAKIDEKLGLLIITCSPSMPEEQAREFLQDIISQFNTFKAQLELKGVNTNGFTATLNTPYELAIHITSESKYLREFIQELMSSPIFSSMQVEMLEQSNMQTPFQMKPGLSPRNNSKKDKKEEEEEKTIENNSFRPSPFKMSLTKE